MLLADDFFLIAHDDRDGRSGCRRARSSSGWPAR
jgi:hypothetical protein